jgi:HK97 family phage prohead protease
MNKKLTKSLFPKIEYRTSESEGKRIVEACIPFNSKSCDLGGFREIITNTAFKRSLETGQNIYAYYNHDNSKILGCTKNGSLELRNENDGLYCKLNLGNTSFANDTWDIIDSKICQNLSFGFIPYEVENRGNLRYLRSVNLKEISFCVSQPAYEETHSIAYTRNKKDYNNMGKKLFTRNLNVETLQEILDEGELIKDEALAKELILLIDPDVLKKLTAVDEKNPASEAGSQDTEKDNTENKENETEKEKTEISEEEKKILELIEETIKSESKDEDDIDKENEKE